VTKDKILDLLRDSYKRVDFASTSDESENLFDTYAKTWTKVIILSQYFNRLLASTVLWFKESENQMGEPAWKPSEDPPNLDKNQYWTVLVIERQLFIKEKLRSDLGWSRVAHCISCADTLSWYQKAWECETRCEPVLKWV